MRSAVSSGRFNPDSSTRYRLMTPLALGVDALATRTCLASESRGRLAVAMMKPRDLCDIRSSMELIPSSLVRRMEGERRGKHWMVRRILR